MRDSIRLLAGVGVQGDAHAGATVQHLYTAKTDPRRVNLRQVHLAESELLDELIAMGFQLGGGSLGANISTRGIDLPLLPRGSRLLIGSGASVEVTGLRAPCVKIERHMKGLRSAASGRCRGLTYLKRSVMGVVLKGGLVRANDAIRVWLPPLPHAPLALV